MRSFFTSGLILFLIIFITACELSNDSENQTEVVKYDSYGTDLSGFRERSQPSARLEEIDQGVSLESEVLYDEVETEVSQNNQPEPPTLLEEKTIEQLVAENNLNLNFYFDFKSKTLKKLYASDILKHAQFLKDNPSVSLILEGHADERGSREFNIGLSEDRALSAKDMLINAGVNESQVKTLGYGEEKPTALGLIGGGEMFWSKNRRVKFNYVFSAK